MSEDSLIDNEEAETRNHLLLPSSSSSPRQQSRSSSKITNLDEHIKLVKQKKEEVDSQRLQRFQEQLRKKEQKWYVLAIRITNHRF